LAPVRSLLLFLQARAVLERQKSPIGPQKELRTYQRQQA
jgi:hypothetical protein